MFFEYYRKYKPISEEEYGAAKKRYQRKGDWWEIQFYNDYDKRPIYAPYSGIMAQINGTAEIIGYRYLKFVGMERVLLYGASEEKLVKELFGNN